MANSITPTYSFTLPEVGADTNAWGGHINGNFTTIDTQMVSRTLVTTQTLAGALALPSNGLNVGSGQLQVTGGNVTTSGNITATGNLGGVNGNFSGTLAATGTTTLGAVNASGAATFATTVSVTGTATFTVPVVASAAPTLGTHLTNKTYVDGVKTTINAYTVSAGTSLTGGGAISTNPTISVAAGGITSTQLASNAVTTVKITDANVTPAKLSQPPTQGTSVASTSGSTVAFTALPSWVRRVDIMLSAVSLAALNNILINLGTGAGPTYATTGYASATTTHQGGGASGVANVTTGFQITNQTGANVSFHGVISLFLVDASANTWAASGNWAQSDSLFSGMVAGSISLPGTLTAVRLQTPSTYDAGLINIQYYG